MNQATSIALRDHLYQALLFRQKALGYIIKKSHMTRAQTIELMLAHIELHPPTDEWVQEFTFRSPPIGRPRVNKLDSELNPPVSEDQPSDSKDEEDPNPYPYSGGTH
ncbi:MAG: hypothetical protein V3R87_02810 [Dehalococcoidia bacterium]